MKNLFQTLAFFAILALVLAACAAATTPVPPTATATQTAATPILLSPDSAQSFTWIEKASMPVSARNGAAVRAGDKIYFLGGSGLSKKKL